MKDEAAKKEVTDNRLFLKSIKDPIERTVVAVAKFGSFSVTPDRHDLFLHRAELVEVISELWPGSRDVMGSTCWDGNEVSGWFADRAKAASLPTDSSAIWVEYRKNFRGRAKRRAGPPEPAWKFPHGSTRVTSVGARIDAFVFTDGRFVPNDADSWNGPYGGETNLHGLALARMAILLRLVPIPEMADGLTSLGWRNLLTLGAGWD